jgi:4-amino-4-deoxy-L-arabinose transferase-like glycosyltransferase
MMTSKKSNALSNVALALILLLAGFLSIFNIWNEGYSNEFYAASVKSMLTSWKNFFFVSLDPGGWVTVDKPPVSLWAQAASAKVFGFYGWSILLPECLAAVATVAIIYHIVRRHFGNVAGLVSALVLALSPIFIVISKTNNTDSLLILFMTLAAWAMMVAADKGQLRWLLLSAAFLGIAYNAKTLEAFLILPALYAVYFFASTRRWRTRIWHLAVATLVLVVVSLSWSVIVDFTPASERPYVDNSTTNSELELALGYNGIQRIIGQSTKGGMQGTPSDFTAQSRNAADFEAQDSDFAGAPPADDSNLPQGPESGQTAGDPNNTTTSATQQTTSAESGNIQNGRDGGNMGGSSGNSMFNGGGSASILRMFNTTLGGQDSWLLPFGLFSVFALLAGMRKSMEADAEVRRKRRANVLLWGGSVITMFTYFSIAQFFHPYYISVMAPFLAALAGIGLTEMWKLYKTRSFTGFLLPLAFVVTGAVQILMLQSYPSYSGVLTPLVAVVTGVPALLLLVWKLLHRNTTEKLAKACVTLGIAGLLIAPAVWTGYSVFWGNINSSIPTAGPSAEETRAFGQDGGQQFGLGRSGNSDSSNSETALISFLEENNTGERFLVAVPSASEAEPIILATDKPVMAIGGFSGNDNTLTVATLQQMVEQGEVKYFMVGGRGKTGGSSSEVTEWVEENGKAVDSSEWSGSFAFSKTQNMEKSDTSGTLYDLSAYKDQ